MNKEAKQFYDCWDVLTLTVITGLLSLVEEIMTDHSISLEDVTEAVFVQLVEEIFHRINLLGRWTDDPSWGSQDFSSDEVLMLSLGKCYSLDSRKSCFNSDQLWYGVRLLAEKQATNYGDGDGLISFTRDSIGEYHMQGNVSISSILKGRHKKIFNNHLDRNWESPPLT